MKFKLGVVVVLLVAIAGAVVADERMQDMKGMDKPGMRVQLQTVCA